MKVVNYIQIDFSRNEDIKVTSIQYDSGSRWVRLKLFNNGIPVNLNGIRVCIMVAKPDGKEVFNDCVIVDAENGLVEFEITNQMVVVAGEVECQIKLMEQDKLLSSEIFTLFVNKGLTPTNIDSENELNVLVDALNRVEHLDQELSGEIMASFEASQTQRDETFKEKLLEYDERFLEIKGEKGDKGDKGDTGERGLQGPVGPQGSKGDVGEQGPVGPQGPKGDKGDQGEVGAIGPIGLTGPQGETGPQGPKGEKGLDGRSVELGVYGGQVKWRYAGQEENVGWTPLISLDSLRGSQGPQGEKGETGPQGPKGEKGDSGGVMPADMVDYMGNQHETLKAKNDADVDWLLGEINTAHYEGQQITATDSIEGRAKSAILKGVTKYRDKDAGEILEAFEEGRNLELVSVTMPVLTTTGINLFDGNVNQGALNPNNGTDMGEWNNHVNIDFKPIKSGSYRISCSSETPTVDTTKGFRYALYDINKKFLRGGSALNLHWGHTIKVDEDASFIRLSFPAEVVNSLQFELGTKTTSYEPYKSNILSTSEEVTLRGIGVVQDTLDCLTGEKIERIGEIVLDGSEDEGWAVTQISGMVTRFYSASNTLPFAIDGWTNAITIICDKLVATHNNSWNGKLNHIYQGDSKNIFITKIEGTTLTEFKEWLSQNPITVQYKLATESIKTVVFKEVDQDGNETVHENGAIVYSHKDTTHYICGSEDPSLIPSLSIDVPTNLPAVVTRQKTMIHELEVENKALIDELQRVEEKSDQADLEQLSTTWEIDYRVSELEWFVEDNISSTMTVAEKINLKLGGDTMALSRFEQAKILILAGVYNRETLEKQLTNYLKRGYLTTEEYDELIALMDAKELVSEN